MVGLRQYWRDKRQQDGNTDGTAAGYEEEMATVCSIPQHHTDEMALKQVYTVNCGSLSHTVSCNTACDIVKPNLFGIEYF